MIRRRKPLRRKTRPRRQSKGRKAEERREADKLWTALILRKYPACHIKATPRCSSRAYLQAHHVISRRYRATRWDPQNGVGACRHCHYWLHYVCIDAPQWYRDHGIDFDRLRAKAEAGAKGLDMALAILALKADLEIFGGS